MTNTNEVFRYTACIIIEATSDVREARGIVGQAIRKALGAKRWHEAPFYVCYLSRQSMIGNGAEPYAAQPRYRLDVSRDEMTRLDTEIGRAFEAAGWTGAPVDIYHD